MSFGTVSPAALLERLQRPAPLLLLDVRRPGSLQKDPFGVSGAVPVVLKPSGPELPDVDRDRDIVVYCPCTGQASSTRVAQWLVDAGYRNVAVLEGGLQAWREANLPTWQVVDLPDLRWTPLEHLLSEGRRHAAAQPLLAERSFLTRVSLPARREMAVLSVDMVQSTRLITTLHTEAVLALVQTFMQVVVEAAVQHCGDVKDFEGDGAMLYFAGVSEALPAAFEVRRGLAKARSDNPLLPPVRLSIDVGELVMGYVGTRERQALCFVGPSINTAARILKQAPPGGIVVTHGVMVRARRTDPALAAQFSRMQNRLFLRGFDSGVSVYLSLPVDEDLNRPSSVMPEQLRDEGKEVD